MTKLINECTHHTIGRDGDVINTITGPISNVLTGRAKTAYGYYWVKG